MSYRVHERGDQWGAPFRHTWECQAHEIPAVTIRPKRLYASVVVNVGTAGRVFTGQGYFDLIACFRRYSPGVKGWSAAGGRRIVQCPRVLIDQADACAAEIVRNLGEWTEPAPPPTL